MKKLLYTLLAVSLIFSACKKEEGLIVQAGNNNTGNNSIQTYIPDTYFEQILIDLEYDDLLDDYVLTANINDLLELDVSSNNITNLTGIEDFTALEYLDCSYNNLISLDVSDNTALVNLFCSDNQLISLDLRNGNNNNMYCWLDGFYPGISVSFNPYLNCINVDDSSYCNSNWLSEMDPQHYYSNNCP